jgi:hypothetical protein
MSDELAPAVVALQNKLSEQLQAVSDTKRTINMLLRMSGQKPLYQENDTEKAGNVRADQFYGKTLAAAASDYLDLRKQACMPEEIMRGLEAGGFDFDVYGWKKDDRLRSFAVSLAKNTGEAGKFHRLKNGTIGLRSWYDVDFLKKAAAAAKPKNAKSKPKRAPKPQSGSKPKVVPKTETTKNEVKAS